MVTSLFEDSMMLDQQNVATSADGVPVIRRVVGDGMADTVHSKSFAFLGCEDSFGYGPIDHTAAMFLDLICMAAQSTQPNDLWTISIHIYNAKEQEYPSDETTWKDFSGIILPGSISSAHEENVPWIDKLKTVIQGIIVRYRIPTLGMCFGHQILAQSFYPNGKVVKLIYRGDENKPSNEMTDTPCPHRISSSRAGRVSLRASDSGQNLLGKPLFDFYATHGDHVEQLPPTAVSLGGDDDVPIQAAVYYATVKQAQQAHNHPHLGTPTPFAVTFQSHLEYATSRDFGLHRTLETLMDQMENRGDITLGHKLAAQHDAREKYPQVERDSIEAMVMAGRVLGWFPSK
eukprot:CAMPEP_0198140790 /NCGR_PEP_ID=MMETSP1443-20131203/3888_1 /TAXON_ID=186043 /ORGANISM="Entomoneis sp., Strain CCMP2396" /LENGTH=344 /DNA_ID=CAMNT_0043803319 /DNA_START=492 /DNA_END=1526 /DNA_ORIENTATION=-